MNGAWGYVRSEPRLQARRTRCLMANKYEGASREELADNELVHLLHIGL